MHSNKGKKKRKGKRERERERERRKRTRKRKGTGRGKRKKKEKRKISDSFGKGLRFELGNCFWKRPSFLLLAPGSAMEKFAANVSPGNNPTKVNWTLSWPSAFEICGTAVL